MEPTDYDNAVTIGFLLGVRLMEALHGLEQSPESNAKINEHLREVAEGRLRHGRPPAELRLLMPGLDPEKLEAFHKRIVGQNQQQAQAVLRVMTQHNPAG
jgi:hypothetical protein